MSGKSARANRRLRERIAELQDMAAVGRQVAADLRAEGDVQAAQQWAAWAAALYRGTDPVIDPGTSELETLARGRAWVEGQMVRQVKRLRAEQVSWQRIGWSIGMTDQGARKWFARMTAEPKSAAP